MAYQEEETTRLRRQSTKQAVALAMQGRWQEAIAANKSVLESFPNDVDAYNRLARAYVELGEYALAKEAYERALELDPYNVIAKRNLSRLSHIGESAVGIEGGLGKVEPQQFIEEVGKTGVVRLDHLAPPEIVASAVAGSRVNLRIEAANLVVENSQGEYLGQVETRHGQRLVKLMEGGNRYTVTVVSVSEDAISVMIREVYQHPSQAGRLSFPPRGSEDFRPYVDDRIIRRELEYEAALPREPSYTIVGGEEGEVLPEESAEDEDEEEEEEGE